MALLARCCRISGYLTWKTLKKMSWSAIVVAMSCLAQAAAVSDAARQYGGLTLEQWQERLGHLDPADPQSASAVGPLLEIVQDDALSAPERRPFAITLGRMGTAATDAIPFFITQIERRRELKEPTYLWSAQALGLYGIHARQAAPALIDMLFDEDLPRAYRTLPVEALARIGTAHPDVLPALIRLLQYEGHDKSKVNAADASVFRELAAEALAIIGPEADLAAPLLVRAIRDTHESDSVRRKAINALGAMGSRGALAIPALIETLEFEQSAALRSAVRDALGKIGQPALPTMIQYLRHTDPQVRLYVAGGIGKMGAAGQPAIPTLIAALQDPDDEVRLAVCEALQAVGVEPEQFVRPLVKLLRSDQRQVRMGAMRLLIALGAKMQPYLELLQELQDDSRADVRAVARKTLERLSQQ